MVNKENIKPPIIQTTPDSDRSECSKPPLLTQKVRTKFSGYVIEYPCTVYNRGEIRTYFDEAGNKESNYQLYLGITVYEDGSIWKKEENNYENINFSMVVILRGNGRNVNRPPLISQRSQMDLASETPINGLTLYRNSYRVVGYLDTEKDASGHPPVISCQASKKIAVEDVFSLLGRPGFKGTKCSASWALAPDIYLYTRAEAIKSRDAYRFKEIYKFIHNELHKSLIAPSIKPVDSSN